MQHFAWVTNDLKRPIERIKRFLPSDFIMCASDETVTALLLVVLEKRIQPTQLKFGHAKIATLLPAKVSRRTEKKHFGTKPIGRWIVGTMVAPRLASVSLA